MQLLRYMGACLVTVFSFLLLNPTSSANSSPGNNPSITASTNNVLAHNNSTVEEDDDQFADILHDSENSSVSLTSGDDTSFVKGKTCPDRKCETGKCCCCCKVHRDDSGHVVIDDYMIHGDGCKAAETPRRLSQCHRMCKTQAP